MAEEPPALLQPRPRRAYDLTPTSTNSSSASSLSRRPSDSSRNDPDPFTEKASRTRSILNLTSSTLFGIYTPLASGFETNRSEPSTPAGNGSQTPGKASTDDSRPPIIGPYVTAPPRTTDIHPHPHETGFWGKVFLLSERIILLFLFGMAYGVIITHLRDSQQVVPVQFDLRGIKHHSWGYLIGWGGIGVSLGALLPWVDVLWEEVLGNSIEIFPSSRPSERPVSPKDPSEKEERQTGGFSSGLGADWNPVVRSIGAFIGIAFAIVCHGVRICVDDGIELTHFAAQASMAIHIPNLIDPRARQPSPLVPCRSF